MLFNAQIYLRSCNFVKKTNITFKPLFRQSGIHFFSVVFCTPYVCFMGRDSPSTKNESLRVEFLIRKDQESFLIFFIAVSNP